MLTMFSVMGCLPGPGGPRPGAVPTGEPLAVVDDVKTWTTTYREKTGETEVKNSSGETVLTEEHYQDRTQLHAKKIWYPVQGRQQINDEDLFRITDDHESLAATRAMRDRGNRYLVLGTGGMVLGIAAMIGARFVGGGGLQIGLYSGGALLGTAGGYGYLRGWELLSPDTHAVDRSIGEVDARRYNQSLRRGAALTILQRQF